MRYLFFFIFCVTVGNQGFANEFQFGPMVGANYSSFQWNTTTSATGPSFSTTGYNASGGLLFSLFSDHRVGMRIAGFYNSVNSTGSGSGTLSAQTATITGGVPGAAATIDFNFDAGPGRHSIGIGYGYESFSSLSCTGTTTFPKSTSGGGLAVDIKEVMKSGLFGYAVGILPVDNLSAFNSITVVVIGIGYDFGASK